MKKIYFLLLLLTVVGMFSACGNLPTPPEKHTVVFKDYDSRILSRQKITTNKAATPPDDPTREGYTFIGWDKDFSKVTEDLEILALYEIIQYTVTFVDHDNTILKTETVPHGAEATAPEDPTRAGYRFVGWDQEFDAITTNLTVTALYEVGLFTVRFIDHDGTVLKTENVGHGQDATPPVVADKPGYTFIGWDKSYTNVSNNLVITAQYDVVTFTVTFLNYDDTVLKVETVEYGKDATAPLVERLGYEFIGWDKEFNNVMADITVKAQFEILTYTVQFVDTDGTVLKTEQVNFGQNATPPVVADKPGFIFTSWDTDYTNVSQDLVITAQYYILTFTVTFLDYDDTVLKTETVQYGHDATAPQVTRLGYAFIGWDESYTNVTADLTVKAQYEILKFNVQFVDHDGTVLKSEQVTYGQDATPPVVDDQPGLIFTGWSEEYTNVTKDLIVKAEYEVETFTVTFLDFDDTVLSEETVEYGKGATAPTVSARTGYQFTGWDQNFNAVTTDITVKAEYQTINFNITYNANGTHIAQVAWPDKESFLNEFYTDLFNWIRDNASKISSLTINNGVYSMTRYTLTATWSNVTELRALDVYDFERTIGSLIFKPFTRVNDEPVIPVVDDNYFLNSEPYRSKYIDFDAYFLNCMIVSYPAYDHGYNQTSNGRVQIFFRFHQWGKGTNITSLNNYPMKYVLTENESIVLPSTHLTYTILDEFTLPEATCEGMTFLGWFTNTQGAGLPVISISVGSYGDITLYAKWDEDLTTHKVTFLKENGDLIEEKVINAGETVSAPTPPTKQGYLFVGWDKDITNITSDIVVTARYELIHYTITYHDNLEGEDVELPTEPLTYTINDKYTLPEVSLEGYLFLGWYDNPECTGLPITETSYGNLELYAYLIQIPGEGETIGDGSVELVATETIIQLSRSTQVYAKMGDVYINSRNLEYISTNEDIATIDDAGFVRARAVGEVVIIVITSTTLAAMKLIVVNEPHQIQWVGHQGSGGPVVQNTVSAFHEGGRRGYYAMECDVRVSADGVYYICHDDVFTSSYFVDSSLWDKTMASYTWNQLKTYQVKDTYGGQTYYGYLATVEEYLNICKQYGAKAVLELKWTTGINSNDQSKLPGLVELVKQCGMYENAIFMSSMKNCLTYIRQNYPDANIQFLSGATTTTQDNINWCIQNKFSLDASYDQITSNFVNQMHNAYLYVNGYTVDSATTANNLKNIFVDMITTNNLGV